MQKFFKQYHYLDHQGFPYLKGYGCGQAGENYFWEGNKRKGAFFILQYTLSGEGIFEVGKHKYTQRSGDFFLAEVPSKFTYYGKEEWQFLYFEFSKESAQWLYPVNQVITSTSSVFSEILLNTYEKLQADDDLDIYSNAKKTFDLLVEIRKEINQITSQINYLADGIKLFLEKNYFKDINLDEMEKIFSISKFKIIRTFEEAVHLSPMVYLRKFRIMRSLSLLWKHPEQSIHQVAQNVGFANGNYFSKVFKIEMGMTPSEYRNNKNYYQ